MIQEIEKHAVIVEIPTNQIDSGIVRFLESCYVNRGNGKWFWADSTEVITMISTNYMICEDLGGR